MTWVRRTLSCAVRAGELHAQLCACERDLLDVMDVGIVCRVSIRRRRVCRSGCVCSPLMMSRATKMPLLLTLLLLGNPWIMKGPVGNRE